MPDPTVPIHAVLLIPEAGDPRGLLREGPCGARPPMMVSGADKWWPEPEGYYENSPEQRHALVLVWEGKHLPMGLVRIPGERWWDVRVTVDALLAGEAISASYLLHLGESHGCTFVLLDAAGQEVTRV